MSQFDNVEQADQGTLEWNVLKAGVTAIAAQQLFGSGVNLRPGQTVEYVITNAEAHVMIHV